MIPPQTTGRGQPLTLLPFLLVLFTGTVCSAMIVPFMGYYIVEGLGQAPWAIGVYALEVTGIGIICNRAFGRWLDNGTAPFPLIGVALAGYLAASLVLSVRPALWSVLSFGALGFGLSGSAVSTMFSMGLVVAEGQKMPRGRSNAYMRATTSTGWMIGPAASFLCAGWFGDAVVFRFAFGLALIWAVMWWAIIPRAMVLRPKSGAAGGPVPRDKRLWLAAAFVFCMSLAHSLTFSALPLFYVREVGLPDYAPGTAFSMKTFVEILAIFATPLMTARFGLKRPLALVAALAAVTISLMSQVQTYPQMLAGAALEGLYYGLYASLGISFIQSYAEDRPAQATALYWNVLKVSGVLAGPAAGLIAQAASFQAVLWVAAAVAACATLMMLAVLLIRRAPGARS
ncbi:MFS transporter [Phaeovulum sp. W22_SRMD_FR3]|uniref:MFS transporter n=1 Tax=Phaeovulum sp. W22_SRMD_FR3 TaxID=3240274 RepID=UPI003F95E200